MTGTDERWHEVLDFWFAGAAEDPEGVAGRMKVWFGNDPAFDREVRERFADLVLAAGRGELDAWLDAPRSALALVILLDQFPRNLYRGSADAFRFDPRARAVCLRCLEAGHDQALHPVERVFSWLPLEHSEDLVLQDRSVELQEGLAREVDAGLVETCESFAAYARQHRDIVREFGRFPHRNAILGRSATDAEQRYLESGGAVFGQSSESDS